MFLKMAFPSTALFLLATTPAVLGLQFSLQPYDKANCTGGNRIAYSGGDHRSVCAAVNYRLLDCAASISVASVIETDHTVQFLGYSEGNCNTKDLLVNVTFKADGEKHCVVPKYLDEDIRYFTFTRLPISQDAGGVDKVEALTPDELK